MAINFLYLQILKQTIDLARSRGDQIAKAGCLSYPDLLVPKHDLERLLGADVVSRIAIRPDAAELRKKYGYKDAFGPIYATESLLPEFGIEPVFYDIARLRGVEQILDLNEPLPAELKGAFDIVIDTGTLEHCFNVGNAWRSMCAMVRQGGWLLTTAPLSMCNHGFWNFSPTAYYDFLTQNGFKIKFLRGYFPFNLSKGFVDISPVQRFDMEPEMMQLCVARREELKELVWPVQSKYRHMLDPQAT